MVLVIKVQSKFIPSPLSRIASTCLDKSPPEAPHNPTLLKGTIPFLVFSLEITSNNLTYEGNGYTPHQLFLLTLVSTLYDRGNGYRNCWFTQLFY